MTITLDLGSLAEVPPLRFAPSPQFSDGELLEFCRRNEGLRVERSVEGDIILMPPSGGETGRSNLTIGTLLTVWAWQEGTGETFNSSAGFTLPNGALRSPGAAWVRRDRLAVLSTAEREKFLPLCPDFVVELMSPSDSLPETQAKMDEYLANGARLGWLIDRKNRRVLVYRPGQPFETLDDPAQVSGDPVLPGFVLDLNPIFRPLF
jgi:Uma2 family endonuclease